MEWSAALLARTHSVVIFILYFGKWMGEMGSSVVRKCKDGDCAIDGRNLKAETLCSVLLVSMMDLEPLATCIEG